MVLRDRDSGEVETAKEPCPVCAGTVRYVRLMTVEPCRACGGTEKIGKSGSIGEADLLGHRERALAGFVEKRFVVLIGVHGSHGVD